MLSILDLKPLPEEKSQPVSAPPVPEKTAPSQINTAPPAPPTAPATSSAAKPELPKAQEPVKKSTRPALRAESVPVSEPVNIPEEAEIQKAETPADEGEYELVIGRRQIATWLFIGTVLIAMFSTAAYYVGRISALNSLTEMGGQSAPYIAPALPEASIVPPAQEPVPAAAATPLNDTANQNLPSSKPTVTLPQASIVVPASGPAAPISSAPLPKPAASFSGAISAPTQQATSAAAIPPANSDVNLARRAGEPPLYANPQPGGLYLQMGAVEKGIAVVLAEGLRRHGFNSIVAPGPTEKIFRVLIGPFATQEDYKRAKAEVDAIDLGTFARRFQK